MTHNDKKISNGSKKYLRIFFICILIICVFVMYYKRIALKERFFNFDKKQNLPAEVSKNNINFSGADLGENNDVLNNNVETLRATSLNNVVDSENNFVPNPPEQLKQETNLKVPFTIQSPDQKWQAPYGEACEEASVLMSYSYLKNKIISIDSAFFDIDKMIDWEMKNLRGHFDISVTTTTYMAQSVYGVKTEIFEIKSINDIKKYLSLGYPVIVPALGRELQNPNFKTPGPIYHMLVVKGYTKDGTMITNDPGTRKGNNYLYNPQILFNAIGDWDYSIGAPNPNKKFGIILR